MIIYIATFLFSSFFIYSSENLKIKSLNKVVRFLFIGLGILIPSILAGVRDYTIGTDVLVYGNTWFNNAVNSISSQFYTKWATSSSIGYLYAWFNFIISRLTSNPHFFYFWYSLIENIILYWALYKNRDLIDIRKGWLTYLAIFYNVTFNLLRNGMALIILLWGFYYVRKNNLIKYIATVIIATLFHSTAILGILIYLIYRISNGKWNIFGKSFSIMLIILFVTFFGIIGKHLGNSNLINTRYTTQFLNNTNAGGGFLVHLILMSLPILILYLISVKKVNHIYLREYNFFQLIIIISFIMSFLNVINANLVRITWYFDIYYILAVPFIISNGVQLKINGKSINNYIFIAYLILYWGIIFGVLNSGQTVPFIFMRS